MFRLLFGQLLKNWAAFYSIIWEHNCIPVANCKYNLTNYELLDLKQSIFNIRYLVDAVLKLYQTIHIQNLKVDTAIKC